MVKLHCAYCGDQLHDVRVGTFVVGVVGAAYFERWELRHVSRRTTPGYRPDSTTRARILRRWFRPA